MGNLLVDARGRSVRAADGTVPGCRGIVPAVSRLVWASMSARYHPSYSPGEQCSFGMDFSFVLPCGAVIRFAGLQIFNNTFLSPDVSADFTIEPVRIDGARVFARVVGGVEGSDYQLRWTVTDSDYNVFPRTAFVLCSQAS